MGFFSVIKKIFGGQAEEEKQPKAEQAESAGQEHEDPGLVGAESAGEQAQAGERQATEPGQPEAGPESGTGPEVSETAGSVETSPPAKQAGQEDPEQALPEADGQKADSQETAGQEDPGEIPEPSRAIAPETVAEAETGLPDHAGPLQAEAEAAGPEAEPEQPDPEPGPEPDHGQGSGGEDLAGPEEAMEAEPDLSGNEPEPQAEQDEAGSQLSEADHAIILSLRQAEPKLSAWLAIVLEGVEEKGDLLWQRVRLLLTALEAPANEADEFVNGFADWLERMEYRYLEEFRSELQYRLALALDLEDEEDERNRLLVKISAGLARTREHLARGLDSLFAGHGKLDDAFWEELEEVFIMADLGVDPSLELVARLKERARKDGVSEPAMIRDLLQAELEEIFRIPPHIVAVNPPEVVLMIGVNGAGKTTTIAKLAHRARMQGKKVMIAAADTFRAAAIEQLEVWAGRVGALFHAGKAGSDPAAVAFQAMDKALEHGVDLLLVDTAGRLQTKINLMEELGKIRTVLGRKHQGAPHRSVLVLDATTGQNALSQTKLFRDAAGIDELILTKMDGTAKGGVAIAIAMQYHLPISFIGLGEKLEDLRPFNGQDYARAILGSLGNNGGQPGEQPASGKPGKAWK